MLQIKPWKKSTKALLQDMKVLVAKAKPEVGMFRHMLVGYKLSTIVAHHTCIAHPMYTHRGALFVYGMLQGVTAPAGVAFWRHTYARCLPHTHACSDTYFQVSRRGLAAVVGSVLAARYCQPPLNRNELTANKLIDAKSEQSNSQQSLIGVHAC